MRCGWCRGHDRVRQVFRDGEPIRSPEPGTPLFLCFRCWGMYAEEGTRPDQTGKPDNPGMRSIPMRVPILRP